MKYNVICSVVPTVVYHICSESSAECTYRPFNASILHIFFRMRNLFPRLFSKLCNIKTHDNIQTKTGPRVLLFHFIPLGFLFYTFLIFHILLQFLAYLVVLHLITLIEFGKPYNLKTPFQFEIFRGIFKHTLSNLGYTTLKPPLLLSV